MRGLSEEANSDDLVLSLGATGVGNQVVCDYRECGLARLKGLRVLDGAGTEMPITSSSWSVDGPGQKRVGSTFIFARPVASVALDVYDNLRAGTVELIYTDLPLGGALGPAQREHEATWRESALPAAFAAPIEIMPPQLAAPPAHPAPAPAAAPGAKAP